MSDRFIPLSVPNLKGNELKYSTEAIKDEWVSTGGGYINLFEQNIANYLGVDEAVAVQSGTAGLHLSLIQSGVKNGDEVLTVPLTFIAAVNPIKYVGADPIFIDCDDSLCMDPVKLQQFIDENCVLKEGVLVNQLTHKAIKAILAVHVFGNLLDLEGIMAIAKTYNLVVIEDATEALGSYYLDGAYKGKYAGTIGDYGVYSFNGNKIITSGGGGMVVAKEKQNLSYIKYLSTQAKNDTLNFIHDDIGFNYRMTNVQAAMGVAQLEQLEQFIETKKSNYSLYKELLKDNADLELLPFKSDIRPNYWFYSLILKKEIPVATIIAKLQEKGVQTRPIWGLISHQKPYLDCYAENTEVAENYVKKVINVPCSSNLQSEDVEFVVEMLQAVLNEEG
ncbi:LegC family aminotransferase [uncultured Vagococcus sp.]|uniref:LegC family aminotransferase n=1 Tax=uncultured Vagococcus sp. TaxID=189676 RepID=UPI0028D14BEB|nr:LegC family aminotransferase [uncultured Vagococcus sp.]